MRPILALILTILFQDKVSAYDCSTLISLAPSITEVVFDLGLGGSLKGNTTYCSYPSEAKAKIKVGGYLDPNYEVMLSIRPTLVLLLNEQKEIKHKLRSLGIETLSMDHSNVAGILHSFEVIGDACKSEEVAENKLAAMKSQYEKLKKKRAGKPLPRVLLAIGRTDVQSFQGIFAAGNDGFLSELLKEAGGINVNEQSTISFPAISSESMYAHNPDVIIEIMALPEVGNLKKDGFEKVRDSWSKFREVSAVKERRVFILHGDFMTIPGPRFLMAFEEIIKVLNE